MKEVLVVKLDKEEQKKFKELEKQRQEINEEALYANSASYSFHIGLEVKYNLPADKRHYIKGNAIYRAED